jgi:phenylacetate-CoA ligase
VTLLSNRAYPLIRFGTGDLSAIVPASLSSASPCGRTNLRIKGWLGRADQATKVKGMFVHPSQVAAIVLRHPGIAKARLVVDNPQGTDTMTLHVEMPEVDASIEDAIVASIREVTRLRGEVKVRAPGDLANDGKVIDDVRRYD